MKKHELPTIALYHVKVPVLPHFSQHDKDFLVGTSEDSPFSFKIPIVSRIVVYSSIHIFFPHLFTTN